MIEDVLIVDDSLDMLEVLSRQLQDLNCTVYEATNVMDAIDILQAGLPRLLITDLQMPGVDGTQLVRYANEHYPDLPILVITGHPSVDSAVDVLRNGAQDYLIKPFTSSELESAVEKVMNRTGASNHEKNHSAIAHKIEEDSESIMGMVGKADSLKPVKHLINRTKDNKVTVLVTGESGTGKELVARAIHFSGKFNKAPFIAVNCGAIPETLLESELFGSVKGAYTGSTSDREGFFQAAQGGTIFLDEIGTASLQVQQRLLRVIQEKEVIKVGSHQPQKIDVRVVTATNANLLDMVEKEEFREDLYYRLNVVKIQVPPLRERKEDIPDLVNFFIEKHGKELGNEKVKVSAKALQAINRHDWPGNVRELENIIHHALIMTDDIIDLETLPESLKMRKPNDLGQKNAIAKSLSEIEKEHILKVLQSCKGNKTKAAEILGITRKTLREKLR